MKKSVLKAMRKMSNDMPMHLKMNNGKVEAVCRYRQMKREYSKGGMVAAQKFYDDVMANKDQINDRNKELSALTVEKIDGVAEFIESKKSTSKQEVIVEKEVNQVSAWLRILRKIYRLIQNVFGRTDMN